MKPKRIVLTGCTRGLGRALVDQFCQRGQLVFGCGRSAPELEELRRAHPAPHEFTKIDVASDSEVKTWAAPILARHGAPDLLINNAALINPSAPLWKVSAVDFDAVVDVNLKGVANVIRHFAPAMIQRRSGVIVNFSSGWGRSVSGDVAPYCATKWAIEGLTQALALELPPGMAAVPLNPGIINTEMLQSCFGASAHSYTSPAAWAEIAAPFLLELGPKDNGKPLAVPI